MIVIEETRRKNLTFNCSYICSQIFRQILYQAERNDLEILFRLNLVLNEDFAPDISVFPKEQIQPDFFKDTESFDQLPILAIEIISPSKNIENWIKKAQILVRLGTKTVWTIEPLSHSIWVTNEGETKLFHNTTIENEGITVDFQKIFGGDLSLQA